MHGETTRGNPDSRLSTGMSPITISDQTVLPYRRSIQWPYQGHPCPHERSLGGLQSPPWPRRVPFPSSSRFFCRLVFMSGSPNMPWKSANVGGTAGVLDRGVPKRERKGIENQGTRRLTRRVPMISYINKVITTGLTGDELRAQQPTHAPRRNKTSVGSTRASYTSRGICATKIT